MLAPMGCFSSIGSFGGLQRQSRSYIKSSTHFPGLAERKAIVRKVLQGRKSDKMLRAAVEVYFCRTASVQQWHSQDDVTKSRLVDEFIDNVQRATVTGVKCVDVR